MKPRNLLALTGAMVMAGGGAWAQALPTVTAARSPGCGCCCGSVDHGRAAASEVSVRDVARDRLDAVKRRIGLRPGQTSCHTASAAGHFIEGHVPAEDVKRLVAERPAARGLAAPGMPAGSPGMEMGARRDPQDMPIAGDGSVHVFSSHRRTDRETAS